MSSDDIFGANDQGVFQNIVGKWADSIFPESTLESIVAHTREEVGELEKALIQHNHDLAVMPGEKERDLSEEAADIYLCLLHLAHRLGFSLPKRAALKHRENLKKEWKVYVAPNGVAYSKHADSAVFQEPRKATNLTDDIFSDAGPYDIVPIFEGTWIAKVDGFTANHMNPVVKYFPVSIYLPDQTLVYRFASVEIPSNSTLSGVRTAVEKWITGYPTAWDTQPGVMNAGYQLRLSNMKAWDRLVRGRKE